MKNIFCLSLLLISSIVLFAVDPWGTPAELSGSMSIMTGVRVNNQAAEAQDVLAAFVTVEGQEILRGKSALSINNNIAGCLLQVFTETNGEVVHFKIWDESAQQIITPLTTLNSEVNGSIGSWPENLFWVELVNSPVNNAYLSQISINGSPLSEFNTALLNYTYFLPWGATQIPTVTATAVNNAANVNIQQASSPNGTATITVTATDDTTIRVYHVNFLVKNIVLDLPATINYQEDSNNVLDLSQYLTVNYYDLEDMSLYAYGNSHITITLDGLNATIIPQADWNGTETITFTVNCPDTRVSATDNIVITIDPVNDAPLIDLPFSFTTLEDEPITVDFTPFVGDIDSPFSSFSVSCTPNENVNITANGLIVTMTPSPNWNGTQALEFILSDSVAVTRGSNVSKKVSRAIATDIVYLVATPVNDPLQILSFLPADTVITAHVGDTLSFIVDVFDYDNTNFSYLWELNGFNQHNPSDSLRLIFSNSGQYVVRITVGDGVFSSIITWHVNVTLGVNDPEIPGVTLLRQNYPNPFNPSTSIKFSLRESEKVKINIFNAKGQKIKTLADKSMSAGEHQLVWDGRNDTGHTMGSGIYLIKMETKSYNKIVKAILVK